MIYNKRVKDIFDFLKKASSNVESKFVQNMLSSSFADIGIEEDDADAEDLESAFEEILDDVQSVRHVGAIIFWILNANISEQKRIGYAESLFSKILETDSSEFYKFPTAIRYLSSGRYGANSQVVLNAIISHGKVKDMLDSKVEGGVGWSNYRLFEIKSLEPYFVKRYASAINDVASRMTSGDIGWRESESITSALSGISRFSRFSNDIKKTLFDMVQDSIDSVLDIFDSNTYVYQKENIVGAISDAFGEVLGERRGEKLDRIISNLGSSMLDGGRGTEIYVKQVKEAITAGDLKRIYELNINEHMPRHEKKIVSHILETSGSHKDSYIESNILQPFFYMASADIQSELEDEVYYLMANRFPSRFLGFETWWNRPTDIDEDFKSKYAKVAFNSMLVNKPNIFIGVMIGNYKDELTGKDTTFGVDLNQLFLDAVNDSVILESINSSSLAKSLKNLIENIDLDTVNVVFDKILNDMDNSGCESIVESLYGIEDEALKKTMMEKVISKISNNMEEYYKCYLENTWRLRPEGAEYMKRKALEVVIEKRDAQTYFDKFYSSYSTGTPYALIPEPFRYSLKRLEKINYLDEALEIHNKSINDIDMESFSDSKIKISKYQTEQRPSELVSADVKRYDLTQDNTNPPPVMYDINKNHVGAADFIMHTELGSSGFTSGWALSSFPEDKLLIEQIQSDYPVVLDRVFNRMPPTKKTYRTIGYSKSDTGERVGLEYHDDGGVYISGKTSSDGFVKEDTEDSTITIDGTNFKKVIMSSEEFESYTERAQPDEATSVGWSVSDEDKREAYDRASSIYRDRSRKIRDRLDDLGFMPSSLYGLKGKHSKDELTDAKKHIEIISQNYPYLIIANAIKTAQRMSMENIYLLKSGGDTIQNLNKRRRIYKELPEKLGAEDDTLMGLDVFRISASDDNLDKLKLLMPIKKRGQYDYSLTPAQNNAILRRVKEDARSSRRAEQDRKDSELSVDKYIEGESYIKGLFGEAGLAYSGPEQDTVTGLLRYLGSNESSLRQAGVSKKKIKEVRAKIVNLRFAEIVEELGFTKTATYNTISLYNMLLSKGMTEETDELYSLFDKISLDNNLLLEGNIV